MGMPFLVSSSWDGTVRLWTLTQTQTQPSTPAHPDGGWNTTLSAVSAAAREQSGTGGQLKCLQMFDSLGLAHDTTLVKRREMQPPLNRVSMTYIQHEFLWIITACQDNAVR